MQVSDSQHVVKILKEWISEGKIGTNERLPAITTLANELHVTRHAVYAAIRQLENDGWFYKQRGRYFVCRPVQPPGLVAASQSIVILADPAEMNFTNMLVPGYDRSIEVGAMLATRQALLHPLDMDPARLEANPVELKQLISQRPVGFISFHKTLIHELSRSALQTIVDSGLPVVVYNGGEMFHDFDTVESDHDHGAYELTKLLIERGRKRILRFVPIQEEDEHDQPWLISRHQGHERAMHEAGIESMPVLRCSGMPTEVHSEQEFEFQVNLAAGALAKYIVDENPIDAVMAVSDGFCFPLITACRHFKKEPNVDIDIVGYDNYWADALIRNWELLPPLATVDKHNFELGKTLVDLLMDRVNHRITEPARHQLIKPDIILLESTSSHLRQHPFASSP